MKAKRKAEATQKAEHAMEQRTIRSTRRARKASEASGPKGPTKKKAQRQKQLLVTVFGKDLKSSAREGTHSASVESGK